MLENKTIEEYCKEYTVEWATTMPEECPPCDICVPYEHPFYRLAINKDTYSDEDFKTYADLILEKIGATCYRWLLDSL